MKASNLYFAVILIFLIYLLWVMMQPFLGAIIFESIIAGSLYPLFIGNRIQINSLLVLFCIIGGMSVFGVGGIFYGSLIAILFLITVDLYHNYYTSG